MDSPACCSVIAYLTKLREELQLMLNKSKEYCRIHSYLIRPTETNIVDLLNGHLEDGRAWTVWDNESTVHLPSWYYIVINVDERISNAEEPHTP